MANRLLRLVRLYARAFGWLWRVILALVSAIVVAAVLLVAIVHSRRARERSRIAEATHMLSAIRTAQEALHAETGAYANVSTALAANQRTNHHALYPQAPREPGNYESHWGGPCPATACNSPWTELTVRVDHPLHYGYSTIAGRAGTSPTALVTINGTPVSWSEMPNQDWYLVTAVGDVDGDGIFSTILATSFDPELRIDLEGE